MILSKGNIVLRPFAQTDAVVMASLANNIAIWNNVRDSFPHPYTAADAAAFISANSTMPTQKFAITYNHEFCGGAGLTGGTDIYRIGAEIGYWLGEPWWGKGIATTAVQLITNYGFEGLGFQRIYASVFPYNTASVRVLEKAGFQLEHIARNAVIKNKVVYDNHVYVKLKP